MKELPNDDVEKISNNIAHVMLVLQDPGIEIAEGALRDGPLQGNRSVCEVSSRDYGGDSYRKG